MSIVDRTCVSAAELEAVQFRCQRNTTNSLVAAQLYANISNFCSGRARSCAATCNLPQDVFIWNYTYPFIYYNVSGNRTVPTTCPSLACAQCYIPFFSQCLTQAAMWPTTNATQLSQFVELQASCVGNGTIGNGNSWAFNWDYKASPALPSVNTVSGRSCVDLHAEITFSCLFFLQSQSNNLTLYDVYATSSFCSSDCAALFLQTGYFSSCVMGPILPVLTPTQRAVVMQFVSACLAWSSCTAFVQPLQFYNDVCDGYLNCHVDSDTRVSQVCPALGVSGLTSSLATVNSPLALNPTVPTAFSPLFNR